MKSTVFVLFALASCALCGCTSPDMQTGEEAESIIRKVFQTDLPVSAVDSHTSSTDLMTAVVYGRFECDEADLAGFLETSTLASDTLEAGANPLRGIEQANLAWWQPASLQDTSAIEGVWEVGASVADCCLVAGREVETERTVVYFMVVYENKGSTGLRPDVKADSN